MMLLFLLEVLFLVGDVGSRGVAGAGAAADGVEDDAAEGGGIP